MIAHKQAPADPAAVAPLEAAVDLTRLRPAQMRTRHRGVFLSLMLCVIAPLAACGTYLWGFAADQYASPLGFTVTQAEGTAPAEGMGLIGAALGLRNTTNRDSEILYQFLRSPALVAALDQQLNLRALFADPRGRDPLFAFPASGTLEDLTRYWPRMVHLTHDPSSGIISLRVQAFSAPDAQRLSQAIADESTRMINALAHTAQAEATRASAAEVTLAEARVVAAQSAMTTFRIAHQMIDAGADVQAQIGLQNALQTQLAAALIEGDMLHASGLPADDIRLLQATRRVQAITERLNAEQAKFGPDGAYAALMATYERLTLERDFAQSAYATALAAHDVAKAEASRQSRFLAIFDPPRQAERAEYPRRWLILGLTALFSSLIWAIGILSYYALRDRR